MIAWIKGLPDFLINRMKDFKHWKKTLMISSMIVVLFIASFFAYQSGFSYQVTVNGETIGAVKEIVTVENALIELEKEVAEKFGDTAHFEYKIEYEKVRVKSDQLLEQKQIFDTISAGANVLKPAAIIVLDGQNKLIVDSTETAQQLLDEIQKPYIEKIGENQELLEVSFGQEVHVITKDVPTEEILTIDQAKEKISQNNETVETYQVVQGDSAWNISRSLNLGIRTLEEANPGKDIEKLKPGESINLFVEKPFIDVKTVEKHVVNEDIKYDVQEEKDSTLYVGQKKVVEEGKKGKKELTIKITFINGAIEERETIEEKIIEEPQTRKVKVGTKARPKAISRSSKPAPTYKGEIGSAIVKTALNYRGVPYRRGGSSPSGFDCSGLTSYVYRQYGISLPRTSGGQGALGGYVSRSNLKPGDLVIFPGHVGIYIGGNNFVHAPRTGKVVQVSSLSGHWSGKFRGGRRVY